MSHNIISQPQFAYLPLGLLNIEKYQRPISPAKVNKIVKTFSEARLHPVDVSYRDGNYYVMDGQHRIAALKKLDIPQAPCMIRQGLTYQEEADLFVKLNSDRSKPTKLALFHADTEAQKVPALEINSLVESVGFTIAKNGGSKSNTISAASRLEEIYKAVGPSGLRQVLLLVRKAWNGRVESMDGRILMGVCEFYKRYRAELVDTDFAKRLSKVEPKKIIAESKMVPKLFSNNSCIPCAIIMLQYFNKGCKKQFPNKF
jgi:hypothetical protein